MENWSHSPDRRSSGARTWNQNQISKSYITTGTSPSRPVCAVLRSHSLSPNEDESDLTEVLCVVGCCNSLVPPCCCCCCWIGRHGESQWNLENRFTGWYNIQLSHKGEIEAAEGGKLIRDAGYKFGEGGIIKHDGDGMHCLCEMQGGMCIHMHACGSLSFAAAEACSPRSAR